MHAFARALPRGRTHTQKRPKEFADLAFYLTRAQPVNTAHSGMSVNPGPLVDAGKWQKSVDSVSPRVIDPDPTAVDFWNDHVLSNPAPFAAHAPPDSIISPISHHTRRSPIPSRVRGLLLDWRLFG